MSIAVILYICAVLSLMRQRRAIQELIDSEGTVYIYFEVSGGEHAVPIDLVSKQANAQRQNATWN